MIFIFVPKFYNLHFNENVNDMIASDLRESSKARSSVSSVEGNTRAAAMKNAVGNSDRSTGSSGTIRKYGLDLLEAELNRSFINKDSSSQELRSSEFMPSVEKEDDVEEPVVEKDDGDDDDDVKPKEEQDYTKGLNDRI
jgi:hypothetical protein